MAAQGNWHLETCRSLPPPLVDRPRSRNVERAQSKILGAPSQIRILVVHEEIFIENFAFDRQRLKALDPQHQRGATDSPDILHAVELAFIGALAPSISSPTVTRKNHSGTIERAAIGSK